MSKKPLYFELWLFIFEEKNEVYKFSDEYTAKRLREHIINKTIIMSKTVERSEIDDAISHYEQEKNNGAFNDKYIEYNSKGNENTLIEQYLEKIKSYLGKMIDDLRVSGEWKIHLKMKINFLLLKVDDDQQLIYSKRDHLKAGVSFYLLLLL